ncbi:hypothetical protein OI450_11335 [Pectobacterium cacticida]|uniref:Uncharacterized protein n=1 Tax=Pectobacterium cacticida TaxID=69221 RepID=A0ABZ2GHE6_9GAMM|nr:hypothetical protein [Pectobacterium cacticida]UYX05572.1 hypothetical protein OI450_11335 [Pectobacterium cacticida]
MPDDGAAHDTAPYPHAISLAFWNSLIHIPLTGKLEKSMNSICSLPCGSRSHDFNLTINATYIAGLATSRVNTDKNSIGING